MDQVPKPGQATLLDSLYENALKAEGYDPTACGLIDALKTMHLKALSPSMVDRAYSSWKKARRLDNAKAKEQL